MGQPMISFARRRTIDIAVTIAVFTLLFGLNHVYGATLRNPMFFSGWILVTGCLVLALLNARKKLPVVPLGDAALWVRFHIYLGWLIVGTFLLHGGIHPPAGVIEMVLWFVFLLVAASGIFGAYLSREVPRRMARVTEPVLFERIPAFRRQLAEEAHDLALRSIVELKSATISQFYTDCLQPFLATQRNLLAHLFKHSREQQTISQEMDALERYLDDDGRAILQRLRQIVAAKDSLDEQFAHLGLMKLWLFVHIPATYSLLTLAAVHVVAVYAYSAGAP